MSSLTKILNNKSYEIKYRWKVEGSFTGWATYKKFKSRKRLEEEIERISTKSSDFVEYKVV